MRQSLCVAGVAVLVFGMVLARSLGADVSIMSDAHSDTLRGAFDPTLTSPMDRHLPEEFRCFENTERAWCRYQNRTLYWLSCPPEWCREPAPGIFWCEPNGVESPCSECSNYTATALIPCCISWPGYECTQVGIHTYICGDLRGQYCPAVSCTPPQLNTICPPTPCPAMVPIGQCSNFICKECIP